MSETSMSSSKRAFKSRGERTIASLLDEVGILYRYEPSVLINDNGYKRIWYPAFLLPQYSVFIEYFGVEFDPAYLERTQHKLEIYDRNHIDVLPVYPAVLRGDYAGYILGEIHLACTRRVAGLERTIYLHTIRSRSETITPHCSYGASRAREH